MLVRQHLQARVNVMNQAIDMSEHQMTQSDQNDYLLKLAVCAGHVAQGLIRVA